MHPIVWSLETCPDDTKQDLVVCGMEFGVVFLGKDLFTTSIQQGIDCGIYHSDLEGERHFRLVVELT